MSGDLGNRPLVDQPVPTRDQQHRERMEAFDRNFKAIEQEYKREVEAAKSKRNALLRGLRQFHVERGGTLDDVKGYEFGP